MVLLLTQLYTSAMYYSYNMVVSRVEKPNTKVWGGKSDAYRVSLLLFHLNEHRIYTVHAKTQISAFGA